MTFFENDSPSNLIEYTVTELSGSIKRTMEQAFDQVRVRGEISGYRGPHSSGHAYFALKDDRARLEAVIWKGSFSKLKTRPEEGMEVIATGKITTFPGSSKYQIVIESLEPAGVGALMALIEERKRKLQSEGLFDAARKQLLPFMPMVIGVVTSPTGAVIRDILHRISDRFPLHVIVWPVKVQGEGSGAEVANAIRGFNEFEPGGPIARPDVLIVARGGGSLEDLWSFNDEIVVRAAASSEIPLISAVGHETDWTLIDYASDQRAPTPTGAAEMAVPVRADLEAQIANLAARLSRAMSRQMDTRRREVRDLIRALPSLDQILALPRRRFDEAASRLGRGLEMTTVTKRRAFERVSANLRPAILSTRIAEQRQKLGERMTRAERVIERMFDRQKARIARADAVLAGFPARLHTHSERQKDRLGNAARRGDSAVANLLARHRQTLLAQDRILQSLSYKNVLKRGYAVIRGDDERVLSSAAMISEGDALSIEFADGAVKAVAGENASAIASPAKKRSAQKPAPEKGNQGSLF
ncbi:exodeoxyribonuclease VII large subunit [Rhizobium sp. TH2]|uniref:exodeoxyribonuclease VII large subunit n=1 Tax=Rhizobium sp. TH2 TaxID=2775403 RepID=UPI002157D601|nr:exodeoxyribonuclease VII large subunit [Rhizobium sp. TH2]UVC09029.1 exodeoxyribonuclease VII large subunit [Rhizobium sp. TH2]